MSTSMAMVTLITAKGDSVMLWITTGDIFWGLKGTWAETKQSSAARYKFNFIGCAYLKFQQERIINPPSGDMQQFP